MLKLSPLCCQPKSACCVKHQIIVYNPSITTLVQTEISQQLSNEFIKWKYVENCRMQTKIKSKNLTCSSWRPWWTFSGKLVISVWELMELKRRAGICVGQCVLWSRRWGLNHTWFSSWRKQGMKKTMCTGNIEVCWNPAVFPWGHNISCLWTLFVQMGIFSCSKETNTPMLWYYCWSFLNPLLLCALCFKPFWFVAF